MMESQSTGPVCQHHHTGDHVSTYKFGVHTNILDHGTEYRGSGMEHKENRDSTGGATAVPQVSERAGLV